MKYYFVTLILVLMFSCSDEELKKELEWDKIQDEDEYDFSIEED